MLTAEQTADPAVDKLIKPDDLASQRVEGLGRRPSRGPGDQRAKIGLLDQSGHVNSLHEIIDVNAVKQGAHIDTPDDVVHVRPLQQGVHVDPVQQRIEIHPVQQRVQLDLLQDRVDVDATENHVQVDACDEIINVQRVYHKLNDAVRYLLREHLHRVGHSPAYRPQPVAWVHGDQYPSTAGYPAPSATGDACSAGPARNYGWPPCQAGRGRNWSRTGWRKHSVPAGSGLASRLPLPVSPRARPPS